MNRAMSPFLSAFWKYNTENTERKRPTLLKEKSFGSNVDCQDCWAKTAMRVRTGHDKTFARVVQNCAKSEAAVNESLVVTQINPVYIGQKSCSCWREQKWHFRSSHENKQLMQSASGTRRRKKGGEKRLLRLEMQLDSLIGRSFGNSISGGGKSRWRSSYGWNCEWIGPPKFCYVEPRRCSGFQETPGMDDSCFKWECNVARKDLRMVIWSRS